MTFTFMKHFVTLKNIGQNITLLAINKNQPNSLLTMKEISLTTPKDSRT